LAYNKRMHSDSKKRRSFLALLFAAGDAKRKAKKNVKELLRTNHWNRNFCICGSPIQEKKT